MSDLPRRPEAIRERFRRAEALFHEARRIPDAASRAAWLERACGDDPDLRDEVERWLDGHDTIEATVDGTGDGHQGLAEAAWHAVRDEPDRTPKRIGRYRILGVIGTGGMGTVYEAEQDDPRRTVALKLLHPELDDDALRRRFRTEGEVLARLHHDGIAHVYDVGEVDTQLGTRLYIAMERVHGVPLRRYVEEAKPDREARLRLLLQIANAVRHAHRNGVIHRDLKPSNILVREDGSPKLLDFGVARRLDDEHDLTRTGHIVGTLRYMSPEQADPAGRVDSRTDVYSLGVIGFEMLAGSHPQDAATSPTGQPGAPLPRLGAIDRSLRGDLSIIFAKALERDPARRYDDMDGFAEDLRRFLDAEPILARPPSGAYRMRIFVARHKIPVAAGALAVLSLVAGLFVAIGAAAREERERQRADAKAREAGAAAYVATIRAAAADLEEADPRAARLLLEGLPDDARGWEWRYLSARLDGSAQHLAWAPAGDTRKASRVTVAMDARGHLEDIEVANGAPGGGADLRVRVAGEGELAGASTAWRSVRRGSVAQYLHHPRRAPEGFPIPYDLALLDFAEAPDGNLLAAGSRSQEVLLFDATDGALIDRMRGHRAEVERVAFAPDGATLASGSRDGVILTWVLPQGRQQRQLLGHGAPIEDLVFLPDRQGLLSLDEETVRLWDFEAADALTVLRRARPGDTGKFVYDVAVSPDGRWLASTSWSGHLEIACLATGRRLARRRFAVQRRARRNFHVRFSPDVRHLAASEGPLTMFDAQTGRRLWESTRRQVGEFAFVDRERLVAIDDEGIHAFDVASGAQRRLVSFSTRPRTSSLALSPDGTTLAYATDRVLHVHSLETGRALWTSDVHERWIVQVQWSPDGATLATASADGTVRLWDRHGSSPRAVLRGHENVVYALAFSPDGSRLASGAREGTIRLWDPATGVNTLVIRGHDQYVHGLVFTPDGRTLVSGSGDGTVRTWSTARFADRWRARAHVRQRRAALAPLVRRALAASSSPEDVLANAGRSGAPEDRDAVRDLLLMLWPEPDSK